jgi:hypothetical protein
MHINVFEGGMQCCYIALQTGGDVLLVDEFDDEAGWLFWSSTPKLMSYRVENLQNAVPQQHQKFPTRRRRYAKVELMMMEQLRRGSEESE